MAGMGWYGPLIDLSRASSHVGDYVQLLVFVHKSTPIQYKLPKGGAVIRTDIQVGDDTRPFFSVSLWQKQMGLMAISGNVILLQNVRITRFGDFVEARTIQCSSLLCLIHPYESIISKGVDDLIRDFQFGISMKEKLRRVIEWVQQAGSSLHDMHLHGYQKRPLLKNWKAHEERISRDCFTLSEVSHLTSSCKVTFYASVGEIFLPFTWRTLDESEKERMFISQRLSKARDNNLVADLICNGCQLCGSPLDMESGSTFEQTTIPLYCKKSSNHLHVVSLIYRPFMLYVWDETGCILLLVKNKTAEVLFGNITAEKVYLCYMQKHGGNPAPKNVQKYNHSDAGAAAHLKASGKRVADSPYADKSMEPKKRQQCEQNPDFYLIWLILLKMLLQQGKNSPLKFEATVDVELDRENGRFEMESVSIPCFRAEVSSVL
ncbi:hypothetical protein AAG906_030472 [Vitis piasezkii]